MHRRTTVLVSICALGVLPLADCGSASNSGPQLTGFGATDAAWNGSHKADPRFPAGSAYDPDPSVLLPGEDPRSDDRYTIVNHESGRVLGYELRFAPTNIAKAKRIALKEFPPDAKVNWFRVPGSCGCAMMQVQSEKLTRTLDNASGNIALGPVAVVVLFDSRPTGNYHPSFVSDARLQGPLPPGAVPNPPPPGPGPHPRGR